MRFFVTGTDTDAGKTFVSCALLRAARAQGLRAVGYKPIESGCPTAGEPGHDARALADAAGHEPESTYMLAPPIAPHLAARRANLEIDFARIHKTATKLSENSEFFLIEGAGGFLVPISADKSFSDIPAQLAIPSIVVAGDRLGAINHTLLTLEAMANRGLEPACVVLSETAQGSGAGLENRSAIQEFAKVPTFCLPYQPNPEAAAHEAAPILAHLRSH